MFVELEKIEFDSILISYEIIENKIYKIYNDETIKTLPFSIEEEINCLYELKRDLPKFNEYATFCVDYIKRDLVFYSMWLGVSFYNLLYYLDEKKVISLLVSILAGVLTVSKLRILKNSFCLKNIMSQGDLNIYYENILVKNKDNLDEKTICELVYSHEDNELESKKIYELKQLKEELLTFKKEIEKEIDKYDNDDTFSKIYQIN